MTGSESEKSPLRGKVALITGGGQGIGLALAHALAAEGCNVVLSARNSGTLQRAVRALTRYKIKALAVVCDVREASSVNVLAAQVGRNFRRLDILINNAGVAHPNLNIAQLPLDTWQDVIGTNLTGMFLVTQAMLPLMRAGGTIVNNLSIAAKRAFPGAAAYSASKHGAFGFTKTLREEVRGQGIRVIALLPGAADTMIWDQFWPDAPRKKMISPKTVARAVVNVLALPAESTAEELTIMPTAGVL